MTTIIQVVVEHNKRMPHNVRINIADVLLRTESYLDDIKIKDIYILEQEKEERNE